MSFFATIPLEALSALTGLGAAALTTLFSRSQPKRSSLLAERLSLAPEWRRFEQSRLKYILEDKSVEAGEWSEILDAVEKSLRQLEDLPEVAEVEHDYLSRSNRAKMVIVSEILNEKAKALAA